ncbi:MAG TPA: hypothetical protein DDW45_03110 [Gammaproteobacteria bacterium]|nr:hypothetical protein [Gammaproteobacteria bacterium]
MGLLNGYQIKWLEEAAARHEAREKLDALTQGNVVQLPVKHPDWVKLTIGKTRINLNLPLGKK